MSRVMASFLLFCLSVPSCRAGSPVVRTPAQRTHKPTRGAPVARLEVFPRVIEEPQPISDAVLAQPETAACLADARELRDPAFAVELSGRVASSGQVHDARVGGIATPVARCLERALADLVVLPGRPGPFRLTLSRQPGGAGAGMIVAPGEGKKFE